MCSSDLKEYLAIEEEVQSGVVISPLGYTTPNQAVARLKKAEQQFDNGQWMTGEEFFAKTRNMIDHYAS